MNQNRKINSLGKVNQRKLRVFTLDLLGLAPSGNIKTLMKKIGASTPEIAYQAMQEIYNNTALKSKQQIQQKKKDKKTSLKTLIKKLNNLKFSTIIKTRNAIKIYSYSDLNATFSQKKEFNQFKTIPFKLTLTSHMVKGVNRDWKFKNMSAFKGWIESLQPKEMDSQGSTMEEDGKNIFARFSFSVSPIEGGRDNSRSMDREFKTIFFTFKVFDPKSKNNNCGIKVIESILNIQLDTIKCRMELKIEPGVMLTEENLMELYTLKGGEKLTIISDDFDGDIDGDAIYFHNEHYYHVKDAVRHDLSNKRTNRGDLVWDIETRQSFKDTVKIGETTCFMLVPIILSMTFRFNKTTELHIKTFTTNEKTCVEQFKEWLSYQASRGKFFNCIAHNCSRFDNYLLMSTFNEHDILDSQLQLRGTSIIGLQYKSHLFKDSCCFLVNSLANLCNGYCITDEEKKFCKIASFDLHGKKVSNTELCFYRPELDYKEFLELQHTDKEFWALYVKYCEYDCLSLGVVWHKFVQQCNAAIGKMGDWLLKRCNATSCNTIGSLAKKLIDTINGLGPGLNPKKSMKSYLEFIDEDFEKYEFVKNFKRGGISHCNQAGKHMEGIMGVDIKSQYPTAMMKMEVPVGESRWIEKEEKAHGFYELKNVVFKNDSFKPVAKSLFGQSLNWAVKTMDSLFVDTWMLEYIRKDLVSYEFVKGLVSDDFIYGDKLFGTYVGTLYAEKEQQDLFKESTDPLLKAQYNKPYREVIKLLLNTPSGKMNEDPSRYFQIEYTKKPNIDDKQKMHTINGVEFVKDKSKTEFKINKWIVAGVMIYSYSKRLLFEYIDCLPNKSNDVIHVETDGIYFGLPHKDKFLENLSKYKGPYSEACIGDKLGNLDVEVEKSGTSYWLGKKFYYIATKHTKEINPNYYEYGDEYMIDYASSKIRIKGIPTSTINADGSKRNLVNEKFYEDIFKGKHITTEFSTITKFLLNKQINLASYQMTRTTKANMAYKTYGEDT